MAKQKSRGLSPELMEQVMNSPTVRAALRAKGERMLPRAQREAAAAGAGEFGRALRLVEGVRPGTKAEGGVKRPYVRVQAEVTEEMKDTDASARLSRTQILRRSARA